MMMCTGSKQIHSRTNTQPHTIRQLNFWGKFLGDWKNLSFRFVSFHLGKQKSPTRKFPGKRKKNTRTRDTIKVESTTGNLRPDFAPNPKRVISVSYLKANQKICQHVLSRSVSDFPILRQQLMAQSPNRLMLI
jgi:hypothetical protein